jgi:outer membrane receptor protein involved in Fe transport
LYAGISYRHSRLELSLTATNLFNQADYSYTLFSGLDRFETRYTLRPRMLLLTLSYHY